MSRLVDKEFALEALLHDLTEAYMGDITTPLKRLIPEYLNIELAMYSAAAKQFNIPTKMSLEVKEADSRILMNEKEVLINSKQEHLWLFASEIKPYPNLKINPVSCSDAFDVFMQRYNELTK